MVRLSLNFAKVYYCQEENSINRTYELFHFPKKNEQYSINICSILACRNVIYGKDVYNCWCSKPFWVSALFISKRLLTLIRFCGDKLSPTTSARQLLLSPYSCWGMYRFFRSVYHKFWVPYENLRKFLHLSQMHTMFSVLYWDKRILLHPFGSSFLQSRHIQMTKIYMHCPTRSRGQYAHVIQLFASRTHISSDWMPFSSWHGALLLLWNITVENCSSLG